MFSPHFRFTDFSFYSSKQESTWQSQLAMKANAGHSFSDSISHASQEEKSDSNFLRDITAAHSLLSAACPVSF